MQEMHTASSDCVRSHWTRTRTKRTRILETSNNVGKRQIHRWAKQRPLQRQKPSTTWIPLDSINSRNNNITKPKQHNNSLLVHSSFTAQTMKYVRSHNSTYTNITN